MASFRSHRSPREVLFRGLSKHCQLTCHVCSKIHDHALDGMSQLAIQRMGEKPTAKARAITMAKRKQKQLDGPCYVPTRVACERLGISPRTLTNWRKAGEIIAFQTKSGRWRYDVDGYIRSRFEPRHVVDRRQMNLPFAASAASPA